MTIVIMTPLVVFAVVLLSSWQPLVAADTPPRPHDHGPFAAPPWDRASPQWQQLDRDLPADHLARRIARAVESLDLQPLYDSYRRCGSLAHAAQRLLQVVLYELHTGSPSPASWERHARESLPVRWLARGCVPSRSRWYAFRDRVAPLLDGWSQQVLQWAQDLGQTTATRGAVDGTLIAALGSRHQLLNEARLQKRLQQLQSVQVQDAAPVVAAPATPVPASPPATAPAAVSPSAVPLVPARVTPAAVDLRPAAAAPPVAAAAGAPLPPESATAALTPPARVPPPSWMARTVVGRQRQADRYRQAATQLQQRLATNAGRRAKERLPAKRVVVCPSEPEAALGLDKLKVYRPLYTASLVLDVDSPLVLAWDVFAQSNDAGTLAPMLQRSEQLVGHALQEVLADGSFASHRQVAAAEKAGVTLYAPWGKQATAAAAATGPRPPRLAKEAFVWQAAEQHYVCPQGQLLTYASQGQEKQSDGEPLVVYRYQCASAHCRQCPQQAGCAPKSGVGRTVTRRQDEESIDRLKARMDTAAAKELYRLRKQTVELQFADWKEHRHLRRFCSRGRQRARAQVGLNVLVHNLLAVDQYAQAQQTQLAARVSLDVIDP